MDFITLFVFVLYFVAILFVGLYAARKNKQETADDYFLAGRKLPWYAVGLSMIGSNISTEHFIGMVGAAYLFGIAPANWEWTAFLAMSLLIFFFLPYYFRKKIYTIPKFLEDRFDRHTRSIFAVLTITHSVFVLLAGALYAGGLIFQDLFSPEGAAMTASGQISSSLLLGIVIVAVTTGIYSIYGGLVSVVWTDVVQVVILLVAGTYVTFVALDKAGGLAAVWAANQAADVTRTHLIRPAHDSFAPWTGVATLWITLGVWYNCANQFYIQRCFGARSEWDARMGIVLAGFIKQLLPLIVVLPGMIAFSLYGQGMRQDKVFMTMVQDLIPAGFVSIVLTGMAAAIMSTVSSLLNSSSTIFTIDVYQRHVRPDAPQAELVRVGRWSTGIILLIGTIWAPFILLFGDGLFIYLQDMAAYFAPPIAVIFLVGILWKRATAPAANWTLVLGICAGILLNVLAEVSTGQFSEIISPFLNRAFINWVFCLGLMVAISLLSKKPDQTRIPGEIIWKPAYARLPESERRKYSGWKNFYLWWGLVLAIRIVVYVVLA